MKTLKLVEKSKIWFSIAIILVLISLGSLIVRGLNFGIDFQGGTIVTIDLHSQFTTDDARQITNNFDKGAEITYAGDAKERIVISTKESLDTQQRKDLFDQFKQKYNLQDTDLISVDTVTATVGSESARNAIFASLVAIILMLIYITFRFEFFFGLSAIIALVYDITIVIGVYALFRIEVNAPFIAAILTILGYSINDTIVVFDRIRENETKMGMHDLDELVNVSISQTLKRSINTVVTTLLAILALYIFGVESIKTFALPLIVGIVSGCYSSIFVASPLWILLQKKFPNVKQKGKSKPKKKIEENKNKGRNKQPQL